MSAEQRVQTGTSRTAEWVCVTRACSFRDCDPYRRSDDWVAAAILPGLLRAASRAGAFRRIPGG